MVSAGVDDTSQESISKPQLVLIARPTHLAVTGLPVSAGLPENFSQTLVGGAGKDG